MVVGDGGALYVRLDKWVLTTSPCPPAPPPKASRSVLFSLGCYTGPSAVVVAYRSSYSTCCIMCTTTVAAQQLVLIAT